MTCLLSAEYTSAGDVCHGAMKSLLRNPHGLMCRACCGNCETAPAAHCTAALRHLRRRGAARSPARLRHRIWMTPWRSRQMRPTSCARWVPRLSDRMWQYRVKHGGVGCSVWHVLRQGLPASCTRRTSAGGLDCRQSMWHDFPAACNMQHGCVTVALLKPPLLHRISTLQIRSTWWARGRVLTLSVAARPRPRPIPSVQQTPAAGRREIWAPWATPRLLHVMAAADTVASAGRGEGCLC